MTFSVLIFAWRKSGTSPAEFAEHYEKTHVPLIRSIAGDTFPLTHTRTYVARSDDASRGYPASALVGSPDDFTYDAFAELTWEDQEAFSRFMQVMGAPENAKKISDDEKMFLDQSKMRAVVKGETKVTSR